MFLVFYFSIFTFPTLLVIATKDHPSLRLLEKMLTPALYKAYNPGSWGAAPCQLVLQM